jgi:ABC-type phosphate/phosphonate transport system substrate-binding protein
MEDEINPQTQTRVSWANTPDVAGAYLAQLRRADAIEPDLAQQIDAVIEGWRAGEIDPIAAAAAVASLAVTAETQGVAPLAARRMKALAEVLASAAS